MMYYNWRLDQICHDLVSRNGDFTSRTLGVEVRFKEMVIPHLRKAFASQPGQKLSSMSRFNGAWWMQNIYPLVNIPMENHRCH